MKTKTPFKRVNISGKIYLQFRVETIHEMYAILKDGGFATGQYVNGWVCYVMLATLRKADTTMTKKYY